MAPRAARISAASTVFAAKEATAEYSHPQVAADECTALSERRGRLHAEIDRLHAVTATVEAQLSALCAQRVDQTGLGAGGPPLAALSRQIGAAFDVTASPAHRRKQADVEKDRDAEKCRGANSSFSDRSCN